jgi:peptidoglycan/xylan/chitin deacetylase (PgdA/CDA1 family)
MGRGSSSGPRIRALTYHRLGNRKRDPFCVSRHVFQSQMRFLAENELAVSLADVEAFLAGKKDLADGSVLVTIDDGYQCVATGMLPILTQFSIPAVAYVTPSLIVDVKKGPVSDLRRGDAEPYLTWEELDALADGGMTIGSHGLTHQSLGRMKPEKSQYEAVQSREILQTRLGRKVASFAYPYGTRADFNDITATILSQAGYTTAFTSQHGAIADEADPLVLPRIKVEGGESLAMFKNLCRGAMDAWAIADRLLWRWQASKGK